MATDLELLKQLYKVFNPSQPLEAGSPAYVDCDQVRGDGRIQVELGQEILYSDTGRTCQLYAGHRGGGKSTELLRLKQFLEEPGEEKPTFRVIYFSADDEDIDPEDAQYTDILLSCTRHLLRSLKGGDENPIGRWLESRLTELTEALQREISFDNIGIEAQIQQIGKLTASLKTSPGFRQQVREKLEPYTPSLIEALNQFLAESLPTEFQNRLVLIADNLDRIAPIYEPDKQRSNYDGIFIDRGQQLKALNCHVIYTVPISLLYSNRATDMKEIYGTNQVLPMIMVKTPEGEIYSPGLEKVKELITMRVIQVMPILGLSPDVFDTETTLEQLCLGCGGHVRDLVQLMQSALKRSDRLPITARAVQRAMSEVREVYHRTVDDHQWPILAQVAKSKDIRNDQTHRDLLFRRCILEYRWIDETGAANCWYDVHPLLKGLKEFQNAWGAA